MTKNLSIFVIWASACVVALISAMQYTEATMLGNQFIPVGNDSFYHARRILDAAFGARGFYQFDSMIHMPEGSWVTWPWAYDYLLSRVLRVAAWISPNTAPMTVLAHIAMSWSLVNTGLFIAICRQLRLSLPLLAIAALAFAGSQLNQQLHGLGVIDHHYIELTFLLLTLWLGLKVYSDSPSNRSAIALGVSLGIATAFHSALFILQLPLLAAAFVIWWRGNTPPRGIVLRIAIALLIATLAVLVPSEPFRQLHFSFHTHSWFHLYIAFCSAAILTWMALRSFKPTTVGQLALGAVVLAIPVASQILSGAQFISGESGPVLGNIAEIKSPFKLMLGNWGVSGISNLYSLLIYLTPITLIYFTWRALSRRDSQDIFVAISAVFCLSLLMMQYRLQYFGSWVLIAGPLLALAALAEKQSWRPALVAGIAAVAYVVAYVPVIQNQRASVFSLAHDPDYRYIQPAFPILDDLCRQSPGTVLALGNDGHYIRYHTACSVVANNLLLTPQHFQKVADVNQLLGLTPEAFVQSDHNIEYLFVRFIDLPAILQPGPDGIDLERVFSSNPPLFVGLNLSNDYPPGLQLVAEMVSEDQLAMPYARIFRVVRQQKN